MAKTLTINKQSVEITNEDKILFPKSKIRKIDIIQYYRKISKKMLPLMKDRPISMFRYPNGIHKEHFVQKNISDYFPDWILAKSVQRKEKTNINMMICNNEESLVYLANQACITPHLWLSQIDHLQKPDRMIFDLDPPKDQFSLVVQGAKELKKILEKNFHLHAFVMTTGSKGVHILVPIKPELEFKTIRSFAKKIATLLVEKNPDQYTIEPRKEKRKKKLFIDYLRNGYAQTAVAPYAVRALEKAPVATPIRWSELTPHLKIESLNIKTVLRRKNPWENMQSKALSIKKRLKSL